MDGVLEILGAFVVQDVEFGDNAGGPELVNQGLVSPNHFTSSPVLHWLNEDSVPVDLGQDHDVLVPMAQFFWEAPWQVGEDLLGGLVFHAKDTYEDGVLFLCRAWQGAGVAGNGIVTVVQCRCSLLGGPQPAWCLPAMPLWCLFGIWVVALGGVHCETWPRGKLLVPDGLDPDGVLWGIPLRHGSRALIWAAF